MLGNKDLYPTPDYLVQKMMNKVNWNTVKNILYIILSL